MKCGLLVIERLPRGRRADCPTLHARIGDLIDPDVPSLDCLGVEGEQGLVGDADDGVRVVGVLVEGLGDASSHVPPHGLLGVDGADLDRLPVRLGTDLQTFGLLVEEVDTGRRQHVAGRSGQHAVEHVLGLAAPRWATQNLATHVNKYLAEYSS